MNDTSQQMRPWWRHGMVWLILSGPAVVVVAGLVTAWIAVHNADTVVDADLATLDDGSANGFVFHDFTEAAYRHALRRAFALYRQPAAWARVREAGMRRACGWDESARHYVALYQSLLKP